MFQGILLLLLALGQAGGAAAIATGVTGAGIGASILVGNSAGSIGGFIAGTIYDDPESAKHPDYDSPTGNLINPYKIRGYV